MLVQGSTALVTPATRCRWRAPPPANRPLRRVQPVGPATRPLRHVQLVKLQAEVSGTVPEPAPTTGGPIQRLWQKLKEASKPNNLAKLGTAMLLSYGFISNINSAAMIAWVWALYVKETGIQPFIGLHPPFFTGKFLAYYGIAYASIGTLLRPVRIVIATAISPYFDRAIATLQETYNLPKPAAVAAVVFAGNIVFTLCWLLLNVRLAFWALKVPLGAVA